MTATPKPATKRKQPKSGQPKGRVMSRLTNGAKLSRIALNDLPKPLAKLKRIVMQYRRDLEAATIDQHGEVSVMAAHVISEAATHEQHASICAWLLRTRLDKMSDSDVIKASGAIASARTMRNQAVRRLDLDATDIVSPSALYCDPSRLIDASIIAPQPVATPPADASPADDDDTPPTTPSATPTPQSLFD